MLQGPLSHEYISLVARKPVFGVFKQVSLNPVCSAAGTSYSIEILRVANLDIILSRKGITKTRIRLCGCTGRLICACVVRMQQSRVFSCQCSYVVDVSQNQCDSHDNLSE